MNLMLDSFWRAAAYCLHPRVILLSLLPLLLIGGLSFALGWFFWEPAVDAVADQMRQWALMDAFERWLRAMGAPGLRSVFAPLIVVALAVPFIVLASLLAVGLLMTPAMVRLVAVRRFPSLEHRHSEPLWRSIAWTLAATGLALLALVLTLPLWLIPPFALVLPPLIWGWLAYRMMIYDALADHATPEERRRLRREHRWPLLGIGVISGYAGGAPSLLFALGAHTLLLAPLLVVVAVWLYTLLFAFASLWFAHYGMAALHRQRFAAAAPAQRQQVALPAHEPAAPVLPPSTS
ncbi:EI24 domain-containing protein [Aquabacterium sp. A7-Y]|uniref:EI24 domain-containing protein n=1 Tax=Aquabacterium sp. A7-Y TaxID=1349605 RepID=UPI00223D55DC|nr:EI24 domain-containing protein [Aquabacterium sp. A7-Y]MCW7537643.1 EI24 domain-containing protein [Aquabacterium sp. A7-Y]